MALTIVGSSVSQETTSDDNTYSDLPLPAGTQAGDTLIFGGTAMNTFTVTDSRLTRIADTNQELEGEGGIWVGREDGSGDPIAVTMTDTAFSATLMRCGVVVLRNTRVIDTHAVDNPPNPATLPVMSSPQAEIVFIASTYTISSGQPVFEPGWTEIPMGSDTGRVLVTARYRSSGRTASESVSFSANYLSSRSVMAVFGLTDVLVAPPARLFPRPDGLGVGGGRIYPPPKSQQLSGRRFGYY